MLALKVLRVFYEEGNALCMFVRAQECTQCVLVSNTECKHNFSLFTLEGLRVPLIFLL